MAEHPIEVLSETKVQAVLTNLSFLLLNTAFNLVFRSHLLLESILNRGIAPLNFEELQFLLFYFLVASFS